MGEDPSTGRPEVEVGARPAAPSEPRDPEQIKREIEATHDELGETVEALAEKTDVKAQAKERVNERKEQLNKRKEELRNKVDEKPLPFAVAGIATVLVIAMLIKRSRAE